MRLVSRASDKVRQVEAVSKLRGQRSTMREKAERWGAVTSTGFQVCIRLYPIRPIDTYTSSWLVEKFSA